MKLEPKIPILCLNGFGMASSTAPSSTPIFTEYSSLSIGRYKRHSFMVPSMFEMTLKGFVRSPDTPAPAQIHRPSLLM